jgi:hypothetical protein
MRLFFVIFVSAAALLASDPQTRKPKTPAKAAPKAADASRTMVIPAGAVQTPDGDFHYTDAQGKKWIYRKTPFGVARLEEKEEDAQAKAAQADPGAGIKATEDGDKVRFERMGPFGMWKWEKNKSELDEGERAALQNSRQSSRAETTSKQE